MQGVHGRTERGESEERAMIRDLPYKWIKAAVRVVRIRYYTVSWPTNPETVVIDLPPGMVESQLRANGWEGMLLAYKYEGEVFNLRKPSGVNDGRQLELHIRGRKHGGGTEVIGHSEASRYEHKTDHINENGLVWLSSSELEAELDV